MKSFRIALVVVLGIMLSCSKDENADLDYRQEMRNFVTGISNYARNIQPGFVVIPQNGQELITTDGEATGPPAVSYLQAIDGQGREDLFYGYDGDGIPTPSVEREYMEGFLDMAKTEGKVILVTDYCLAHSAMQDSYDQNALKGYISFAADHRELDHIPAFPDPIFHENASDINTLNQAKNFLYLLNPGGFSSKAHFLDSLQTTNYDLLIIDLFYTTDNQLTKQDVESLKTRQNGGKRLVICYMSIGEAESYRYYWVPGWESGSPVWLGEPNPDWPGNYNVRYWDPGWQAIIYGNDNSYLKRILDAGFDGVYLDIVDAFEYYE